MSCKDKEGGTHFACQCVLDRMAKLEKALKEIADKEFDFGTDAFGKPIGCSECGGTEIASEALAAMEPGANHD
jgi:hypothetical protein